MKRMILPLMAMLLVSGCVTLLPSPGPVPQVFRLDPPAEPFAAAIPVGWTISVARPAVSRVLSGPDIVLREGENRVAFVAAAEWAEPIPALLQRTLAEALNRSAKVIATTPEAGTRADCELQWDVQAFDVLSRDGVFHARLETNARLVDGRRRTLVAAKQSSSTASIKGHNARAAVAALTEAAQIGIADIGNWALLQQCQRRPVSGTNDTPAAQDPSLMQAPTPRQKPVR